jgi:hypothetical protein
MHAHETTNTQLTMFGRHFLLEKKKHRIGTTFNSKHLHSQFHESRQIRPKYSRAQELMFDSIYNTLKVHCFVLEN